MLKKILFFLFVSGLCCPALAQDAWSDGQKSLDLGVNFLPHNYEYGELDGFNLPVTARLNIGKNDWLSFGPYAGFANYNYQGFYGTFNWKIFTAGMQAKAHLIPLLYDAFDIDINDDKFDIYFLAGAGAEYWSLSSEEYRSVDGNFVDFNYTITGGIKYMFAPKWGIYAEGGRSVYGAFNTGISKTF